jgi:hypothetical protein
MSTFSSLLIVVRRFFCFLYLVLISWRAELIYMLCYTATAAWQPTKHAEIRIVTVIVQHKKYILCSALIAKCMDFGHWRTAVVQACWVWWGSKRCVCNFSVTRSSVLKEAERTNLTLLLHYWLAPSPPFESSNSQNLAPNCVILLHLLQKTVTKKILQLNPVTNYLHFYTVAHLQYTRNTTGNCHSRKHDLELWGWLAVPLKKCNLELAV